MSDVTAPREALRSFEANGLLAVLGASIALSLALAVGFPGAESRMMALVAVGGTVVAAVLRWPLYALFTMYASSVVLIVWVVFGSRSMNAIDLAILPIFLLTLLGSVRSRARSDELRLRGEEHGAIRFATRRLTRSVVAFYALAALTLVGLAVAGHPDRAMDSGLLLLRALQGLSFFVLGMWWLREEAAFRGALRALEIGTWTLIGLNLWYVLVGHIRRAGMTWVLNQPEWPMTSPNEAAVTLLFVAALIHARPASWRGHSQRLLMLLCLVTLVLTQSRSGLLGWVVYAVASFRWRWPNVLRAVIVGGLALPMVPSNYWGRLWRTLVPSEASFETFGTLIRLLTWDTAWKVLMDHPWFGVGYLGFRFVSAQYNEMRLVLNTVENYYLEVATGMGFVGLALLLVVLVALLRLDGPVRACATPGTLAHGLAQRHRPLMLGLMAANLTGDNFMGMVGLAQLSIWCALLIRAGHLEVQRKAATAA